MRKTVSRGCPRNSDIARKLANTCYSLVKIYLSSILGLYHNELIGLGIRFVAQNIAHLSKCVSCSHIHDIMASLPASAIQNEKNFSLGGRASCSSPADFKGN